MKLGLFKDVGLANIHLPICKEEDMEKTTYLNKLLYPNSKETTLQINKITTSLNP